jgi:hypothetical protein
MGVVNQRGIEGELLTVDPLDLRGARFAKLPERAAEGRGERAGADLSDQGVGLLKPFLGRLGLP